MKTILLISAVLASNLLPPAAKRSLQNSTMLTKVQGLRGPSLFYSKPCEQVNKDKILIIDSIIDPAGVTTGIPNVKVLISNGEEGLEFSPLSSLLNGALIQPVNRSNNKGVSTAFYLTDTASWSFYTNSTQRLLINGAGNILANSPLSVNYPAANKLALKVNGNTQFDSSVTFLTRPDSSTFISINSDVKRAASATDDGISPFTTTPTEWAQGQNLPVFRLRHPLAVAGNQPGSNTSVQRDFMILPYQFGTAIEYNGVVECWVGEWSVHRGLGYIDTEGKGNGWGGVLWVGDDNDKGGIRATARDNSISGGTVNYGELSVESFGGLPHGDMRLRLPSNQNAFQFIYGERGSNNIVAKISDQGLVLPKVASAPGIPVPEEAQLTYDNSDNQLKFYNGAQWVRLADNTRTGTVNISGNGTSIVYYIAHGLASIPSYFNVIATSSASANIGFVNADATYLVVHYARPPAAGTNNLSFNWMARP